MTRPWRLFGLIVAAALAAGTLSSPVLAQTPPNMGTMVPVDAYIELSVLSFNDELCVGDTMPIAVSVLSVVVYSDGHGKAEEVSRNTGRVELIRATVADTSVASVTPDIGDAHGQGRPAAFSIVANKVGTTTITYRDVGFQQAQDVTEPVVVRDCHWELSMVSVWKPVLGFRPTLLAALINVRLQSAPPGQDATTPAKLSNGATAPPYGDCVVTYEIERTDATIRSRVLEGQPLMRVGITFTSASPDTIVCHVPYVGGGRSNTATPQPLTFSVDTSKQYTQVFNLPHIVTGDGGTWRGTTTITMRKVRN